MYKSKTERFPSSLTKYIAKLSLDVNLLLYWLNRHAALILRSSTFDVITYVPFFINCKHSIEKRNHFAAFEQRIVNKKNRLLKLSKVNSSGNHTPALLDILCRRIRPNTPRKNIQKTVSASKLPRKH